MSDFKFDYNISDAFDREAFDATCQKLDSHIPPLEKGENIKEDDGSEMQFYYLNGKSWPSTSSIFSIWFTQQASLTQKNISNEKEVERPLFSLSIKSRKNKL